jgi:hypothetical protein
MDKMYYGMAALEVSEGTIDPALMIKAMSLSEGDEKKGRATYIELRAKELEFEHRKAKVTQAVITTATVTSNATKAAAKAITSDEVANAGKEIGKIFLWLIVGCIGLFLIILFFQNQAAKVANNYLDNQSINTTNSEQAKFSGYPAEISELMTAAANGNISASLTLGDRFYNGTGVTQDHRVALNYFTMAAQKGNAIAQYNIAVMFDSGIGTEENDTIAEVWYKQAYAQGIQEAHSSLNAMYKENSKVNHVINERHSATDKSMSDDEAARQRYLESIPEL